MRPRCEYLSAGVSQLATNQAYVSEGIVEAYLAAVTPTVTAVRKAPYLRRVGCLAGGPPGGRAPGILGRLAFGSVRRVALFHLDDIHVEGKRFSR